MRLVTSILVGVLGAAARFEAAAEVAGFKMHAIGVTLMIGAVAGVVASILNFRHVFTAVRHGDRAPTTG